MEEIVMVPVPRSYLGAVYRVIGEGELGAGSSPVPEPSPQPAPAGASVAEDPDSRGWSFDEISRMYRESPPVIRRFLGYLADRPDQVVTAPEAAEHVYGADDDKRRRKLPGALGAFGRRVKNRYGKENWPFRGSWSYENEVFEYKIGPTNAQRLREIRDEG